MFTSSKEERHLIEGYEQGVNSYVEKPVDFGEFSKAVQEPGHYWLVRNEAPPAGAGLRRPT